jgi:hypothetical protein
MIVGLFSGLALCAATITTGESTSRSRRQNIAEVNYEDNFDAALAASGDGMEEALQLRAPYFFEATHSQSFPLIKDHPLIMDKDGILFHDYTKDQMPAVAEDPNAKTLVLKLLLRHVDLEFLTPAPTQHSRVSHDAQANLLS